MQDQQRNKPNKVFRCGAVRASIWANRRVMQDAVVEVHSIRIEKSYKEGDQWKQTMTLSTEDLPKAAIVAQEAYKYLRLYTSADEPGRANDTLIPGCGSNDE